MARYEVVEVPSIPGDDFVNGWGLNDNGIAVGATFGGGQARAIVYDPATGTQVLNPLKGSAEAINNDGDIVENAAASCGATHAFLAHRDGSYVDLGTLAGATCSSDERSQAHAVSSTGVIVGCANDATGRLRAFRYDGALQALPGFSDAVETSCAFGINDVGTIVGNFVEPPRQGMFLWTNGAVQELAPPSGALRASAVAINNEGQVLGSYVSAGTCDPDIDPRCTEMNGVFVWQNGQARALGSFQGKSTVPRAMNDHGQIVGLTSDGAFLWENGQFYDLATLVSEPVRFYEAHAINARGEILASGNRNGRDVLMVLKPLETTAGPVAVARFDSSTGSGDAPLWEGFDGTRSYTTNPGAWITSCHWDFGDGTADEHCWALHEYTAAGDYTAKLTVTDSTGAQSSSLLSVHASVDPGPISAPTITARTAGAAPVTVYLDGTTSHTQNPNTWIARCAWDFGDGSAPGNLCWADHVFTQAGHYTVRFTVTDNNGLSNTAELPIDIP